MVRSPRAEDDGTGRILRSTPAGELGTVALASAGGGTVGRRGARRTGSRGGGGSRWPRARARGGGSLYRGSRLGMAAAAACRVRHGHWRARAVMGSSGPAAGPEGGWVGPSGSAQLDGLILFFF
jgi:hypothetical protein